MTQGRWQLAGQLLRRATAQAFNMQQQYSRTCRHSPDAFQSLVVESSLPEIKTKMSAQCQCGQVDWPTCEHARAPDQQHEQ